MIYRAFLSSYTVACHDYLRKKLCQIRPIGQMTQISHMQNAHLDFHLRIPRIDFIKKAFYNLIKQ